MRLRALIFIVILAGALWGGYWFVGATALERALTGWIADRRDEGWVAEYDDLTVRGFPNRFDTTISGITLADPETQLMWSAPFFQILSLSYKPHHVIAVWPNDYVLASPEEKLTIGSDKLQGSVVFVPGVALELDRATVIGDAVTVTSDRNWRIAARELRLGTARTDDDPLAQHIGVETADLRPTDALLDRLSVIDVPETIDTLRLDATVRFDRPWDRTAVEVARPQITDIDLAELRGTWGGLDFRATGQLTVSASGTPEGKITVRAVNWRDMVAVAVATGALPAEIAPTIEGALEILAGMSGRPDTLDAPLTFRGGLVSFGPIPLGPAPNLTIR